MRRDRGGGRIVSVAYDQPNAAEIVATGMREIVDDDWQPGRPLVCVCVGTDRSTGDALGPLVGSFLDTGLAGGHSLVDQGESWAYLGGNSLLQIFGTLDNPVHASNLATLVERLRGSAPQPFVVAIDACLGQADHVGLITVSRGALRPGAGVNKMLPELGNVSITGTVNVSGFMEYMVLQNTRLHLVVRMATAIARGVALALSSRRVGASYAPPNEVAATRSHLAVVDATSEPCSS